MTNGENLDSPGYREYLEQQAATEAAAEQYIEVMRQMTPMEVVALFRDSYGREDEGGPHAEQILFAAFKKLPEDDLDHARAVFRAFTESPLVNDRRDGAVLLGIGCLTPQDHELGMELMLRLVRDADRSVRHMVMDPFNDLPDEMLSPEADTPEINDYLAGLGLTRADVNELEKALMPVDQGYDPPFDLGAEMRLKVERHMWRVQHAGGEPTGDTQTEERPTAHP